MKVLIAICLLGLGLVTACGRGPTAAEESSPIVHAAPPPTPTPGLFPCRPYPKCQG